MTMNTSETVNRQTVRSPAWTRVSLTQVSKVVRGASPRPAGDPKYFNGDYIPWLTVAALTNLPQSQLTVTETAGKLTEAGAQYSRTLHPGTVIIANSGATLGVAKILGIRCCANDGIAALLELRSDVDARYVVHQINSQTENLRTVVATGNGQPNLNTGLIGAIEIDLPAKEEQSAIADALGSADALIDSLEQLLAKKRQIKQGAMQELLTGKRRLPGFKGAWLTLPAREIGIIKGGSCFPLNAQGKTGGEYPFFKVSDMNSDGNESVMTTANHYISDATRKRIGAMSFPAGSIVFAKVGAAVFLERKKILGQASCIDNNLAAFIVDKSRAHVGYFHKLLLNKKLSALVATTALPSLTGKQLGEIPLAVPPLLEQAAIAQVLSDMDADIAETEARLTKARDLKQAMAQALLTGRVRLVEGAAA